MEIKFSNVSYYQSKDNMDQKHLNEIDLTIKENKIIALNGSQSEVDKIGKMISLLLKPSKGSLFLNEIEIKKGSFIHDINSYRKNIGYVFRQNIFSAKTVNEEIEKTIKNFDYKCDIDSRISAVLKLTCLPKEIKLRDPNNLSRTEKNKVALACALSYNPEIIILENFDYGLSHKEKEYFKKLIKRLKNDFNKTILLINFSVDFSLNLIDELIILKKGKIVYQGNDFYDDLIYKYLDMPKIIEMVKYLNSKNIEMLPYTELSELLKAVYRSAN